MEDLYEYEIDSLIQCLKEMGIKGVMKYTDVLVLSHLCERGVIKDTSKDGIIKTLKEQTDMEYREIIELYQKYEEFKEVLPSYSLNLNLRLEKISKQYNSLIPFRWVDKGKDGRLLGFVLEGDKIVCYDGSGNHLMMICEIDSKTFSVHWNNYPITTTKQQRYILGEIKGLKERKRIV